MFAQIKTNGATHILINIPHEGAATSLPAITAMFERNAVFVQAGWNESKLIKPEITISLGDSVALGNNNDELCVKVPNEGDVLDDSFVIAEPQVFVSNAKKLKELSDKISALNTELAFVKSERDRVTQAFNALNQPIPDPFNY